MCNSVLIRDTYTNIFYVLKYFQTKKTSRPQFTSYRHFYIYYFTF